MSHILAGTRAGAILSSLVLWLGLSSCLAPIAEEDEVAAAASALTISNCTGAAISAAVAAGGDVQLDCGSTARTISVPSTSVTRTVRLLPISTGRITLTHSGRLFRVQSNASLEIRDIDFNGAGTSSIAVHGLAGSTVKLVGTAFSNYTGFVVSVHGSTTQLSVDGARFSNNTSTNFAGPIYSEGATATVQRSTFSNNRSTGLGGAIVAFGNLTVSDSTFIGNSAAKGGAVAVQSTLTHSFKNCTFVNNRATSQSGALYGDTRGGGVVMNCTFSDNSSPTGMISGAFQLTNSVLVDTKSPATASCQLSGSGNLQWPATRPSCGSGFTFGDPRLASLASNGGPTQTMALQTSSSAIDRATAASCPTTDQRGVTRPRDGDGNGSALCDLGAYER